jgi:hypothetical protein
MIGGVVGAGPTGTQQPGQGFTGLIEVGDDRVEAEPMLVGGVASPLSEWASTNVPSKSITISSGPAPAAHATARARARDAAMLRSPSACTESITRNTVGSDATSPNRSGWLRNTAMSARQSPPSASDTARWVSTTPGSCTERRWRVCVIAADKPSVRPTRSASSASNNTPAWPATPVPSPVTFTRRAARVPFTFEVPSRSAD